MKTFAALPAAINSRFSELVEHAYWGDSFAKGECVYLIAPRENGKNMLIVSHGTWQPLLDEMKDWDRVDLRHTQTGRITYTLADRNADIVSIHNVDEMIAKYGDHKMPTWTLK